MILIFFKRRFFMLRFIGNVARRVGVQPSTVRSIARSAVLAGDDDDFGSSSDFGIDVSVSVKTSPSEIPHATLNNLATIEAAGEGSALPQTPSTREPSIKFGNDSSALWAR